MNTIIIHSEKPDDIYFINELAKRLGLETEIDTSRMQPPKGLELLKKEDKKLAEIAFLTSSASLEKFFEDETEKMF